MMTQRHGAILTVAAAVVLVGMAACALATTWDVQPFVNTAANEYYAVWSPDGLQMAYVSDATGVRQLWIVNADGTGTWQVTNDSNGVFDAVWSPDSQSLVYTQSESAPHDVVKVDLNATRDGVVATTNLTDDTLSVTWEDPRFSPDGATIMANRRASGTWQIYQVWPALLGPINIEYAAAPAWRPWRPEPEGSLVAYALGGSTAGVSHIYTYDLASSTKLVDWNDTNLQIRALAWSPDGTKLAFSKPYDTASYLGIVNEDGTGLAALDAEPAACAHQVYAGQDSIEAHEDIWSADGTQLVYSCYEGYVWNVYTINADGTGKELVASSAGNDIRARFFGNGKICFESEASGNWDIYIASAAGNQPPVAEANGPYITLPEEGALVLLDGSLSSDPDGDPLTYSWKIGDLEIGIAPSFQWLFPIGLTDVTLTVTDPEGASDTAETEVTVTAREVAIDIKPGDDENTINLGSQGVLRVAFLTDDTFNASTIDPLTVTLAGRGFSGLIKMRGKRNPQPMASFEDIDEDGDLDLLVYLEIENLALEPTATVCMLGALTTDGWVVQGQDIVNIVGE